MAEPNDVGPMRDYIRHLPAVAENLVGDLDVPDDADIDVTSQAELDAIATLTGLTEDDLVSLCIVLTKRLIAAERHSGPGTYDDPTPDDNGRIDEGGGL
jgi:hypothetical protein